MSTKSDSKMPPTVSNKNLALCINNKGYEVSVELTKFYRVVPDANAEALSQLRIVDESGDDYLYPAAYFARVPLPWRFERRYSQLFDPMHPC